MAVEDQYFVSVSQFGTHPEIPISAEKFAELKEARCTLTAALRIEEAFEIIVANYLKFEKFLLSESLEHLVRQRVHTFHSFSQMRTEVNVLLSAFLTAARFYRDSLPQFARACIPDVTLATINAPFSEQYDAAFEFRFMEVMRNYAQHNALPADSLLVADKDRVFTVEVFSTRRAIQKKKFKIYDELPERVDLRRCARVYLHGLSVAHRVIREQMAWPTVGAWAVIESQRDAYNFKDVGKGLLAAFHFHGVDLADKCWLGVDVHEKRVALMADNQNCNSPFLVDGMVSNRFIDPKDIPKPDPHGFN